MDDIKVHEHINDEDFEDICLQPKIEFSEDINVKEHLGGAKGGETGEGGEEAEDETEGEEEEEESDDEWMHGKRSGAGMSGTKEAKGAPKQGKAARKFGNQDIFSVPIQGLTLSPLQSFEQLGPHLPTYKQVLER